MWSRAVAETLKIVAVVLLAVSFSTGLHWVIQDRGDDCRHCRACKAHPTGRLGRIIGDFTPQGKQP